MMQSRRQQSRPQRPYAPTCWTFFFCFFFMATLSTSLAAADDVDSPSTTATTTRRVPCQVELQLDDHPEQVALEVRGPVPSIAVAAETSYGDLSGGIYRHDLWLEPEQSYNFLLLDQGGDGIVDGKYVVSCKFGAYDRILLQGDASHIGDGGIFMFHVQPPPNQRQAQLEESGEAFTSKSRFLRSVRSMF